MFLDYSEIKDKVDYILGYTQELSDVRTEDLFEKWETNKKHFRNFMPKDKLWIEEKNVSFELTPEVGKEKVVQLCDQIFSDLHKSIYGEKLRDFLLINMGFR